MSYNDGSKERRRQARMTIVTALRMIRDLQLEFDIPGSEVLQALALIYRDIAFYNSYRWVLFAAKQIKKEESGGRGSR